MSWRLLHGDCVEQLRTLDADSIDAVVTDPPYGIGFMGHAWDQPGEFGPVRAMGNPAPFASGREYPAAHVVGGLQHAMERAQRRGAHHSGTGFDTRRTDNGAFEAGRYDFSPAANQRFQAWCEAWATQVLRVLKPGGHLVSFGGTRTYHRMVAGIEDAGFEIRDQLAWLFGSGFPKSRNLGDGRGTALKPAHEPIVLARKPMVGSARANVDLHGTGGLNIDACKIALSDRDDYARNCSGDRCHEGTRSIEERGATDMRMGGGAAAGARWPANVVLDEEAGELLDEQTGTLTSGANPTRRGSDKFRAVYGDFAGQEECEPQRGLDRGGASRFFYCAKTSALERSAGLDRERWPDGNPHPTVKPIELMRWLCRLVTPRGGALMDLFAGSGTTGIAAVLEGYDFVGLEREPEYVAVGEARIAFWAEHGEDAVDAAATRADSERDRQARADAGQLDLLEGAA